MSPPACAPPCAAYALPPAPIRRAAPRTPVCARCALPMRRACAVAAAAASLALPVPASISAAPPPAGDAHAPAQAQGARARPARALALAASTESVSSLARAMRQTPDTFGSLVVMPAARAADAAPWWAATISTEAEREMMTRLLCAVLCGAVIGVERRAASATAGLRTLALVSLGSAIFTLTAVFGLPDPGAAARVGAAVASGVGFLGAGAINRSGNGNRNLTTSASIWISASTGVASACGLHRLAFVGAIVTVFVLRWTALIRYGRLSAKRNWRKFLAVLRRRLGRRRFYGRRGFSTTVGSANHATGPADGPTRQPN